MALEVNMLPDQPPEAVGLIADRRLLLSADKSRVVDEGDGSGAFLLAAVGRVIPVAEVKRLGLVVVDGRVVAREAAAKEKPKPADKQRKKATTKSRRKKA